MDSTSYYGWVNADGCERDAFGVVTYDLIRKLLGASHLESFKTCKMIVFLDADRHKLGKWPLNETASRKFQRAIVGPVFFMGKNQPIVEEGE